MPDPRPLSAPRARFVAEYLVDLNATQAALRAGYSARTARAQGARLLTNVDIAREIAAAGGWASIKVMRESYQHSDAATIYAVVDRATATETDPKGPSRGHTLDTPSEQVAQ